MKTHDKTFATYNIFDDKIRLALDHAPDKTEVEAMKKAGFSWWPGQNLNVCKWSIQAEDYVLSLGIQIEEICEADDVESRVERFEKYAAQAEKNAESATDYLIERANTKRRQESAEKRIEHETSRAMHWQQRIAGAIRNRDYKDNPDVIERRIKKLGTDKRREEKDVKNAEMFLAQWEKCVDLARAKYLANYDHLSTGDGHSVWSQIEDGILTDYTVAVNLYVENHNRVITECKRTITHIEKRIEFETALLEASK